MQALTAPAPVTRVLSFPAGLALLVAGAAVIGWLASVAGPVSASREWRAWLLSAPLDRNPLLRRRATAALALALLPGLVLGAAVAEGMGIRRAPALCAVVVAGCAAVTASAVAICWQRRLTGRVALLRWRTVIAAGAATAVASRRIHLAMPAGVAWWLCAAAGASVAAVSSWRAIASVGAVPMAALTGSTGSAASLLAALQEQSLAPLAPLWTGADSRRPNSSSHRALNGTGQRALLAIDRRRLLRNRPALLRWAVAACLPYGSVLLFGALSWGPVAVAVVTVVAAVAAVSGLCSTVREVASTPSLTYRYGLDRTAAKRTAMAIPYLGALIWGLVTAPALLVERPAVLAIIIPVVALAIVEYRAALPPYEPTYLMGQQYPVDLTNRLTKGPAQYAGAIILVALLAVQLT